MADSSWLEGSDLHVHNPLQAEALMKHLCNASMGRKMELFLKIYFFHKHVSCHDLIQT